MADSNDLQRFAIRLHIQIENKNIQIEKPEFTWNSVLSWLWRYRIVLKSSGYEPDEVQETYAEKYYKIV